MKKVSDELYGDKYVYIYAYCFLTNGVHQFSLFDTMNGKLHFFDMCLFKLSKEDFRKKRIRDILKDAENEEQKIITDYIDYLVQNKLARLVDNIENFPLMSQEWDCPYHIKHAVIDVRNIWHDFNSIFLQLSKLLCPEIEIRSFSAIDLPRIIELYRIFKEYDFALLHLLIPYSDSLCSNENLLRLSSIMQDDYRISLNIHGVPQDEMERLDSIKSKNTPLSYNLILHSKSITSIDDCGVINIEKMKSLNISQYMENKRFNGCLNRKISIDENGFIRNCPSMKENWGNIKDTTLMDVYNLKAFQKYWYICNDMITTCNECELRCVCLGCRAYISDPNNPYSKPSKCKYNP